MELGASEPRLRLRRKMELDFGGIGKEYAVDRALSLIRETAGDIPVLVQAFLKEFSTRNGKNIAGVYMTLEAGAIRELAEAQKVEIRSYEIIYQVIEDVQNATPGKQVTLPPTTIYEPGNATLTFDPSENAAITDFSQGVHVVTLLYWPLLEGRGSARSFAWTFEVF